VLTYGLADKSTTARDAWQQRTRRQLYHLMMAGNPAPLSHKVTVLHEKQAPIPSTKLPPDRDDNPQAHPQRYHRKELRLDYTLTNPYGGTALKRRVHVRVAVPTDKPPRGGKFPAVLAVNGHGGSAWKMLNPDDGYFWYGDAFARRGFVVMAVDVSHRPSADRHGLYTGYDGDDPAHGNGTHPAIKAPEFDSDWEEDGERAWDAMRALDQLLARKDVDSKRVLVTGLSMGGEMTTILGALEPRLAMSIPAGFSPDLGVMQYHGNHQCWQWLHADIHEYVDTSDFYALTAPRPLIIQTGKRDGTFSSHKPPFAADKQVVRRSRVAYGKGPLWHYLHYDEHHWHVGSVNPTKPTERGVRVPVLAAPDAAHPLSWQTDGRTKVEWKTLFDGIKQHLK
jgi:hypothetical protein